MHGRKNARNRKHYAKFGLNQHTCREAARALGWAIVAGGAGFAVAEDRSINGWGNNATNPAWGGANTQLTRGSSGCHYGDTSFTLGGASRPSPRAISNAIFAQTGSMPNGSGLSDWVWQWGQFMDHDLDLTGEFTPAQPANIPVPAGDPFFDPGNTGTQVIGFNRSNYDPATGTGPANPRQQMNQVTSWIDASNVYGSDAGRASWLRTGAGGRLKTTASANGDLMPFNDGTQANAGGMGTNMFVAGDVRSNEQVGLTATHTVFVREHNRLAAQLETAHPGWGDEQIYQEARKLVGAELQQITYNEFLPALLGQSLPAYTGYHDDVDPSIANSFSTAAFRIGHTMLSPTLQRLDNNGNVIPEGNLSLADSFFNPTHITDEGGISPILKGLASQSMQEIDAKIVDPVRNFLFGPPGAGGFDLASLNIQRGRDHGLPDYNTLRAEFGLAPVSNFAEITSDPVLQALLESTYGDINDIDPWVGGLAEDHMVGGNMGELFTTIILDQFIRLRDGDRFWYELSLSQEELDLISGLRLSDILGLNTGLSSLQGNVFYVPEPAAMTLLAVASAMALRRRR